MKKESTTSIGGSSSTIELFADMVRWCPHSENKKQLVKILKEQELSHDLEYKLKDFLEGYKI